MIDNAVKQSQADRAADWWRALQGLLGEGSSPDRAALAQLRRCDRPLDALFVPAGIDLVRRLCVHQRDERAIQRATGLAALLAQVKPSDAPQEPLMRKLGWQTRGKDAADTAKLSEQRLRRALAVEEPDEQLAMFRRLVAQAGNQCDPRDLADSYLKWGDRVRTRWAFQYYHAEDAAPSNRPEPQGNGDS